MANYKYSNTIKPPKFSKKETKTNQIGENKDIDVTNLNKKLKSHDNKLRAFFIILLILGVYSGCAIAVYYSTGGKISFDF